MREAVHCVIHGIVQGVFFRASTQREAQRLGLVGWVKNLPDGGVELMAEGPRVALDELATWCSQGPPGATVDAIDVQWTTPHHQFRDFAIVR